MTGIKPTSPYRYAKRYLDITRHLPLELVCQTVDNSLEADLMTSMEWRAIRETIARDG